MSTSGPSPDQLERAYKAELVDKDGNKHLFGELVQGKKVAVLFIRHYWCGNCQAYVRQLHGVIPPSSLDSDTSIIIISCGSSSPISSYIDLTQTPYPVYGNPSVDLYKIFEFTSNLNQSKAGEEKDYMKAIGGTFSRTWQAVKDGPLKNMGHVNAVGPKSQNGGELILEKDGSVIYFSKMANTTDHTDLKEIAKYLGVEGKEAGPQEAISCENGVQV